MKEQYEARMLRIHFGENDKWHGNPLYEAIVNKCREIGIASATVYRGIEGFGASSTIHRRSIWSFSKDAPITVSIIDKDDAIQKLVPVIDEMIAEGLAATSHVQVIRYSRSLSENN